MYKPLRHKGTILKILNNSFVDLPTPSNISLWWNYGSMLGLCLMMQMITGILLSMHYQPNPESSFKTMMLISSNINMGWLLRYIHANGASLFFICLYIHTGRGIYYSSFKMKTTWIIGTSLMLMLMATAFLGYVLPWGQMSFWGATVITNLVTTTPYIGEQLTNWIWGGFTIDKPTLTRFFTFHFMLPFILLSTIMIHLVTLHSTGSNNPLGMNSNMDKLPFHPLFSSKDSMGFILILTPFILMNLMFPLTLNDPENFTPANPLVTPTHIQPEWYFLFAYTILRSIPNKLGGVIALISAIMILLVLPMSENMKFSSKSFYPLNKILFWTFTVNIIMMTWIGAHPVETPYVLMGQASSWWYFIYFVLNPLTASWWDKMIS